MKVIKNLPNLLITSLLTLIGLGTLMTPRPAAAFDFLPPPQKPENAPTARLNVFYQGNQILGEGDAHREQLAFSSPIMLTSRDELEPAFRGGFLLLEGVGTRSPDTPLWRAQPALSYTRRPKPGAVWRALLAVESPSDRPFTSMNETALQFTGFYARQTSERHRWTFYLNYTNLRPGMNHIPLPGIAYGYVRAPHVELNAGFPYANLKLQAWERLRLNAFYFFPFIARAETSVRVVGPVFTYVQWEATTDTYFLQAREDPDQALYVKEQAVCFGLRSPIAPMILADLRAGYRFDRSTFEARRLSNPERAPVLPLPPGPFLSWTLAARF